MTIHDWQDGYVFTISFKLGADDIDDAHKQMEAICKRIEELKLVEEAYVGTCSAIHPGGVAI